MAMLPFNKTWTKEGNMMALVERPGKIFNFDGQYKCPVSNEVIRRAVEATMAPFGTVSSCPPAFIFNLDPRTFISPVQFPT